MNILSNYYDERSLPERKDRGDFLEQHDLHYGRIVKNAVRHSPMRISEIARQLNVSRRTLYNWFKMKEISLAIISKIGFVIDYDFSKEFPEEVAGKIKRLGYVFSGQPPASFGINSKDPMYYWMDRYMELLKKFNEKLNQGLNSNDLTTG